MSRITSVKGFISSNDKTYKKHCNVLRACIDAELISLPEETAEYFGDHYPSEHLFEDKLTVELIEHEWTNNESSRGIEIKVSELPEGVETIRFINSW